MEASQCFNFFFLITNKVGLCWMHFMAFIKLGSRLHVLAIQYRNYNKIVDGM